MDELMALWTELKHMKQIHGMDEKWDTLTELAHINEIEDMDSICIKLFKWM